MNIKKTLAASVLAGALTVTAAAAPASANQGSGNGNKEDRTGVTKVYKNKQFASASNFVLQSTGDATGGAGGDGGDAAALSLVAQDADFDQTALALAGDDATAVNAAKNSATSGDATATGGDGGDGGDATSGSNYSIANAIAANVNMQDWEAELDLF